MFANEVTIAVNGHTLKVDHCVFEDSSPIFKGYSYCISADAGSSTSQKWDSYGK